MPDEVGHRPNTMSHTMKTKKATEGESEEDIKKATEDESEDDKSAEDESEDESESEDEDKSEDDESEDEDKSEDKKSSSTDEELDLDAELEAERKAGEPDPTIAKKAFKEREGKREEGAEDEEDESANADKPLTQKDLDNALARDRRERQRDDALVIAKEMAGSEKEAELIVAKWANRTFPRTLTLREQIREAYVITHAKKLIGERDEAMRGLKGKHGVNKNPASAHKEGDKNPTEPKLPPADAAAIRASGFSWSTVNRRYEKKLPNGRLLIRDPKTKQVRILPKGQK